MPEKTSDQLILLDSRSIVARAALVFVVALSLFGAFTVVRWQIGRLLVETASPSDRNFQAVADYAASLAPGDPQAIWAVAQARRNSFFLDQSQNAIREQERALRLSSNDYRFWLDLARTREQAGEREAAEAALRQAVELAPNYAFPRWMLGNFLLRSGRRDEAFAEFRRVAEIHSTLRQQVFYLAWENLGENPAQIEAAVGDAPQIRAALVPFYAAKSKSEDALRVWQNLTPEQKQEFRSEGETAAGILFGNKEIRAALLMLRELGNDSLEIGKINNGSFEAEITNAPNDFFNWHTQKIKNADVTLDGGQRAEGRRSLRLGFNGYSEPTLQIATQFVAVESGARYRLTFAVKTAELTSAGSPLLEVVDARTSKALGASQSYQTGTRDWRPISVEFTVPRETDAVSIRTARAFCGWDCPIVGVVWYDDFKLERLGKSGK